MAGHQPRQSPLGPRLALAELGDQAVLLDLNTGSFYRLNRVAARIGRELIEGRSETEIVDSLSAAFSIPRAQSARDVQTVLRQLSQPRTVHGGNPITFQPEASGYRMSWNGEAACHLEPRLGRLSLCPEGAEQFRPHLNMVLQWAAPHLLALAGQSVLHASAVEWNGDTIAFCGSSGVGKTTLAQKLAQQGAILVSEDLVLLDGQGGGPSAVKNGEAAVRAWVAAQTPVLAAQGWVTTAGVLEAASGPCSPLRQMHFIAPRSPSRRLEGARLSKADALVRLLENGFAELGVADVWLKLLRTSEQLVQAVEMRTLTCPEGVAALEEALADYNWITKS